MTGKPSTCRRSGRVMQRLGGFPRPGRRPAEARGGSPKIPAPHRSQGRLFEDSGRDPEPSFAPRNLRASLRRSGRGAEFRNALQTLEAPCRTFERGTEDSRVPPYLRARARAVSDRSDSSGARFKVLRVLRAFQRAPELSESRRSALCGSGRLWRPPGSSAPRPILRRGALFFDPAPEGSGGSDKH